MNAPFALRAALALLVVAWLLGPAGLRSAIPVWLAFVVALGLELHFFLGARRASSQAGQAARRLPQAVDRERYGYLADGGELLLVRDHGSDLWIPYAGESGEELDALIEEARARVAAGEEPLRPSEPAGGGRRRPYLGLLSGLAVIAVLGGLAWIADSRQGWNGVGAAERTRAEARFSAEAARIAGHRVSIRCDESGTHVGFVQHTDGIAEVGGSRAYLTPERCYDLDRLAFHDEVRDSRTGRALAVLAHESWHLRGVRDEATTECYARQSGVALGERLGLSAGEASRLMRQQLVENSLRVGGDEAYRVPPGCREGGPLDLAPNRTRFP